MSLTHPPRWPAEPALPWPLLALLLALLLTLLLALLEVQQLHVIAPHTLLPTQHPLLALLVG